MKFRVVNSKYTNARNLLNLYPELKNYNFTIDYPFPNVVALRMTIEINDLEELLKLKSEIKKRLLLEMNLNP